MIDIEAFANEPDDQKDRSLELLVQYSQQLSEKKAKLEEAKEKVAELNKEIFDLEAVRIVSVLAELGVESITLSTGEVIGKKVYYNPKVLDSAAFFGYLRENGIPIVKTKIDASFGVGEEDIVKVAEQVLTEAKVPFSIAPSVHASTLKKFVKEVDSSGELQFLEEKKLISSGKFEKATFK